MTGSKAPALALTMPKLPEKLGQRRVGINFDRRTGSREIVQRPAGIITQIARQHRRQRRFFRNGPRKLICCTQPVRLSSLLCGAYIRALTVFQRAILLALLHATGAENAKSAAKSANNSTAHWNARSPRSD